MIIYNHRKATVAKSGNTCAPPKQTEKALQKFALMSHQCDSCIICIYQVMQGFSVLSRMFLPSRTASHSLFMDSNLLESQIGLRPRLFTFNHSQQ